MTFHLEEAGKLIRREAALSATLGRARALFRIGGEKRAQENSLHACTAENEEAANGLTFRSGPLDPVNSTIHQCGRRYPFDGPFLGARPARVLEV